MSEALSFKTFVSETEIEEKRKKRQEEWDKVRTADQPEECPEEEYDNRSLFDRLQEQKDKKQAEYDDQHQFKNMVRGLDDDESKFLDEVAVRQMELENQKRKEEQEILREVEEYKDRVLSVEEPTSSSSKTTDQERRKILDTGSSKKKSQAALLVGAVKRKQSDSAEENSAKKPKTISTDSAPTSSSTTTKSTSQDTPSAAEPTNTTPSVKNGTVHQQRSPEGQMTKVVAVLPGLGHYQNSDDSDTSESASDSELDLMGPLVRAVMKKKRVHPH